MSMYWNVCLMMVTVTQGRIKLFGAPRQWKHFRPLFQAVFLSGGECYPPQTVKHHASQSQDRNNKYFILYIEFCIKSEGPGIDFLCRRGFFPVASDSSMCPAVDSASKNEYQDNPRGKGGRCVKLTTYHLHVRIVKKSGSLNLLEPCGPVQACNGIALRLPLLNGEEWSAVRSCPLTPWERVSCISMA